MAATESNMMPLGTQAPNFELIDAREERMFSLNDVNAEKGLAIIFMCNHCPYVKHILPSLLEVAGEYIQRGISFISISSNDAEKYPADSFEKMKELTKELSFPMPYLYDEKQDVAKAYDAACTPDFYLFNSDLKLVYRGQYDSSRPGNEKPVTGLDLKAAMDALISGSEVSQNQTPSIGCGIKWKG